MAMATFGPCKPWEGIETLEGIETCQGSRQAAAWRMFVSETRGPQATTEGTSVLVLVGDHAGVRVMHVSVAH